MCICRLTLDLCGEDVVWMCICRLTLDLCGELLGLIPSLVRSLQPVLLTGLQQSGKRYVSNDY